MVVVLSIERPERGGDSFTTDRILQNVLTGDMEIYYTGHCPDTTMEKFKIFYRHEQTDVFTYLGESTSFQCIHEKDGLQTFRICLLKSHVANIPILEQTKTLLCPKETFWVRRKNIFLNQWRKEKELWKVYWARILCLVFLQWVHLPATAWVYHLYDRWEVSKAPLLQDMGFRFFGKRLDEEVWGFYSTLLTFTLIGFSFLNAISPFFVNQSTHCTVHYLQRFFTLTSVSLVARIFSFLSTILPSPDNQCRHDSPLYHPPSSFHDFFLYPNTESGCADLVFSSHTMYSLSSLYVYVYYGRNRFMIFLLSVSVVFNSVVIVGVQRHYTLDVWLAWYCVTLLYLVLRVYDKDIDPN